VYTVVLDVQCEQWQEPLSLGLSGFIGPQALNQDIFSLLANNEVIEKMLDDIMIQRNPEFEAIREHGLNYARGGDVFSQTAVAKVRVLVVYCTRTKRHSMSQQTTINTYICACTSGQA